MDASCKIQGGIHVLRISSFIGVQDSGYISKDRRFS